MKTKITLLSLLAILFFITNASAQCTTGIQYPYNNYSPLNSGAFETITNNCNPGEYVWISNVSTSRVYTFASSVSTDYITLASINNQVLAHGPSGLTYIPESGTNIKYYIHSNASCATEETTRSRYIASQPLPSCGTPKALTVSNITSNSCRISWTPPSTAPGSGYEVYASTANITPIASAAVTQSTTTNSLEPLSGLNPATNYYFWVRSSCGLQKGVWVYGGGFTTNAFTACNGATYGLFPATTFTPSCSGTAEQISATSWAGQYSNINASTDKQYTFSSSVATDYITITNAAGTVVYATGATPLTWSSSAVSGVIRYYIHSNASCGIQNSNRIKSVTCTTTTCGMPSNFAVSNITANSCKVTWTEPAVLPSAGYELYRNTTGSTPLATTAATQTAASNIINLMTGLIEDTTYHFWVRSVCGINKSAWISGGSFRTNPLSGCSGAYNGFYPEQTFTPAATGASETIATDSKAGQYSKVNIVPNKQYTFTSSESGDYITVTNESGSVTFATGSSPLSWPSNTYSGVVRYYLHSSAGCGTQSTNRTRSITCAPISTCSWPIGVAALHITSVSAMISWTPNGANDGEYRIAVNSSPNGNPSSITTSTGGTRTNGIIANQLRPNTVYYYYVQKYCGSNVYSPWISGGTFKTLSDIYISCNEAYYGIFPMETYTPACTGSFETITDRSAASQFSYVNIAPDKQYTFDTSTETDYMTVTNEAGTEILAKGLNPMTWNSGAFSGIVRYYVHTQVACGSSSSARSKYIKCIDSCIPPGAATVSNVTAQSANLFWTGNASSFQYYYATTNTVPANNYPTTNNVITAKTITVNNLTPGATYYTWVRSVCGGATSQWVAGQSFTTFAGGCFTGSLYPNSSFTPSCNGGPETVTLSYAGQYTAIHISPSSSYTFASSVATDYVTITNENGTVLYAHGLTPLNWSSTTNTGLVRFYLHTNINCGVENVVRTKTMTCVTPNTCGLPANIAVSNITSNSAQLSYTAPANAPSVGYQFQATLTNTPPSATVPAVANTIYTYGTASGLSPNTTYYSWVRSICITGASLWVAGPSFTTIPAATTGCNGAANGLWPIETFTPICSGNAEVITTSAFTGQYSNINIATNKRYTFSSSISNDYITITNENGTVTYAAGITPLEWYSASTSGIARFHLNSNANCGVVQTERTKSISCATPVCDAITAVYTYNITSNSMTWDWTSSPSGNYQYYYSTQNIAPTGSSTIYSINANRIELQGLSASTVYYYWVRVNCGSGIFSTWSTGSFTTGNLLLCNGTTVTPGYSGLYPATTFTPTCSGTQEVITNSTWAGEYSNIAIIPNKTYTFLSSVATDHITITSADGNTLLSSGTTPVTWSSGNNSGTVRFFLHTNASCGSSTQTRTRSIICNIPCTAPVTPTFTQVAPICYGGYLNQLPSSSTNGINGSWSPALNNMATTTYTFTPTLGQCAVSTTMTISVTNPSIVPTFAQVGPICPGSYINPLPVDSTNGIHGSWSPALNNMATTTYTFTPMPGQCAVPTTMTIATTLAPNRVPTFTQVAPICIGNYLEPLPNYSNEQIFGEWTPQLNRQATTTYTFTPASGQCAVSTTMTITVNTIPAAPTSVNSCGPYILPALPSGYFYSGTNHEGTSLAQGTAIYYSQTVYLYYDNMPCSTQTSFDVNIQPIFNTTVLNGGTITALMAGTGVTYQWYKCLNGNSTMISGATSQSFTPTENGSYQVKIEVPGCGSVFSNCVVIDSLGIDDDVFSGKLKIYPNPSRGQFTIETGTIVTEKITVIDNLGRIIKTVRPSSTKTELDIAGFSDGIYLIKIEDNNNISIKKVVLKR